MERYLPAALEIPAGLAVLLTEAAITTARQKAKTMLRPKRGRRGQTLRPGLDTPLWNELAAVVRSEITRYGEKAKLGRILGLPRQRVHELLNSRLHLPDAERTLLLLSWLHVRRRGLDLA
jgi:hypothetical protein